MDSSSLNSLLTSSPSEQAVAKLAEALLSSETGRQAVKRANAKIEYEKRAEYRKEWQRNYNKRKREEKNAKKES